MLFRNNFALSRDIAGLFTVHLQSALGVYSPQSSFRASNPPRLSSILHLIREYSTEPSASSYAMLLILMLEKLSTSLSHIICSLNSWVYDWPLITPDSVLNSRRLSKMRRKITSSLACTVAESTSSRGQFRVYILCSHTHSEKKGRWSTARAFTICLGTSKNNSSNRIYPIVAQESSCIPSRHWWLSSRLESPKMTDF